MAAIVLNALQETADTAAALTDLANSERLRHPKLSADCYMLFRVEAARLQGPWFRLRDCELKWREKEQKTGLPPLSDPRRQASESQQTPSSEVMSQFQRVHNQVMAIRSIFLKTPISDPDERPQWKTFMSGQRSNSHKSESLVVQDILAYIHEQGTLSKRVKTISKLIDQLRDVIQQVY